MPFSIRSVARSSEPPPDPPDDLRMRVPPEAANCLVFSMESLDYFTFRRQRAKGDVAVKVIFSMPIRGLPPAVVCAHARAGRPSPTFPTCIA
jgi:hypothetical protein